MLDISFKVNNVKTKKFAAWNCEYLLHFIMCACEPSGIALHNIKLTNKLLFDHNY